MSTLTEAYQVHQNDKSEDANSSKLLDNLVLTKVPRPTPGPGEALVRIRAAALNYRDLLVVAFSPMYPIVATPGLVPAADGAGEIEATGEGSKWANSIGQGVVFVANPNWLEGNDTTKYKIETTLGGGACNGTLTQYAVVKDEALVRMPKNMTFEEAAGIGAAGGTAVHALDAIKIGKGTTILTQGTGGVSCLTIQIASALGARVIATTSSKEKMDIARGLGASEVINYKTTPDWGAEVLKLTDGKGVDLVVEVGGANTIKQSLIALKEGGTVSLVGFLSSENPPDMSEILGLTIFAGRTLKGIRGQSKAHLIKTVEVMEKHDLHPPIGTPYAWEDAAAAFEVLRKQDFVGKVVIKV